MNAQLLALSFAQNTVINFFEPFIKLTVKHFKVKIEEGGDLYIDIALNSNGSDYYEIFNEMKRKHAIVMEMDFIKTLDYHCNSKPEDKVIQFRYYFKFQVFKE